MAAGKSKAAVAEEASPKGGRFCEGCREAAAQWLDDAASVVRNGVPGEHWPLGPAERPHATSDLSKPWTTQILGYTLRVVGADGGDIAVVGDTRVPQNWEVARLILAVAAAEEETV